MILLIKCFTMELFCAFDWIHIIKWIDLSLWLYLLVIWQVISCCKLPSMEFVNLNTMSKKNIVLLTFFIWKHIFSIHLLIKFWYLWLDSIACSIWIYRLCNNRTCYFGCWLIKVFGCFIKLVWWFLRSMFKNFPCKYIWNLLSINIIDIASFSETLPVCLVITSIIIILSLRKVSISWTSFHSKSMISFFSKFIWQMIASIIV